MSVVELRSETRALRQSREQTEVHSNELESQLEQKLSEIAALHDAVDRLQKEKRQLLVELNHVQSVSGQQSGESNALLLAPLVTFVLAISN